MERHVKQIAKSDSTLMLPYCFTEPLKRPFPDVKTHFFVENPPYKIDTLVYVGDAASLIKFMKKNYGRQFTDHDIDFESADGITVPCKRKDGSQFVLIWLAKFTFSLADISVLVHEILHATVYILRMSGVRSVILEDNGGDADDENLAYSMGEMFERIMFTMSKKYQKVKNRLIPVSKS